MELRSTTIKYSKQKRSELKTKEQSLQKELQELDFKICNGDVLDEVILDRYETAKEELKKIHESRRKEAMFRSKTKWLEHGEKPTKYFYNLEKTNYDKKCIREIKLENEITSNFTMINKEIENFYKNMYTSKVDNIQTLQPSKGFSDYIKDINTPRLSKEEQEDLDQSLSCQELKDALNCFAENKTPGEDGFTKEFYVAFFGLLWGDLLNSYNEAFSKGILSISQRRGTITLLSKGDTYLTDLTNWRPISLLNIDYKILTKILALRLEKYLPKLIHGDQTGFVKGRYIGQNIRLMSDLMEDLDQKNLSGIFLFIDFEKAFDTLEWSFILDTLKVFNFGSNFIKWFSTIYNGSQSAVLNGGYLTNYFEISRG
ncbi:hypothetical protein ACROYT_G015505 [Oculina patagonica]